MSTRRVEIEFLGNAKPVQDTIAVVRKDILSLFKSVSAADIAESTRSSKVFIGNTKSKIKAEEDFKKLKDSYRKQEQASEEKKEKYLRDLRLKSQDLADKAEAKSARDRKKAADEEQRERTKAANERVRLRERQDKAEAQAADRALRDAARRQAEETKLKEKHFFQSLRHARTYYEAEAAYSKVSTKQLVKDIEAQTQARLQAQSKARQALASGNAAAYKYYSGRASDLGADNGMLRNILMQRKEAKFFGAGSSVGVLGVGRSLFGQLPGIGPIISAAGPIAATTAAIYGLAKGFDFLEGHARRYNDANTRLNISMTQTGLTAEGQAAQLTVLRSEIPKLANDWAVTRVQMTQTAATIQGVSGATGRELTQLIDISMAMGPIFGKSADQMADAIAKAADPEFVDALKKYGIYFGENATLTEKLSQLQARFGTAIQEAKKATQDSLGAYDRLKNALSDTADEMSDKAFSELGPMLRSATPWVRELGTAFGNDLVFGLRSSLEGLNDFMTRAMEVRREFAGSKSDEVNRMVMRESTRTNMFGGSSYISGDEVEKTRARIEGQIALRNSVARFEYETDRRLTQKLADKVQRDKAIADAVIPPALDMKAGQGGPKPKSAEQLAKEALEKDKKLNDARLNNELASIALRAQLTGLKEDAVKRLQHKAELDHLRREKQILAKHGEDVSETNKKIREKEVDGLREHHKTKEELEKKFVEKIKNFFKAQAKIEELFRGVVKGNRELWFKNAKQEMDAFNEQQLKDRDAYQARLDAQAESVRVILSPVEQAFMGLSQTINDQLFGPLEAHLAKSKNLFEKFFGSVIVGFGKMATEMLAKSAIFGLLSLIVPGSSLVTGGLGAFLGLGGLNPLKRAKGGKVSGPGGPKDDEVPAWLSNGEHVWTAEEVQKFGGQTKVERFRAMVRRGLVKGFRVGGPITESGTGAGYNELGSVDSYIEEQRIAEERARLRKRKEQRIARDQERAMRKAGRQNSLDLGDYSWLEDSAKATAGFLYGSLMGPAESLVDMASFVPDAFMGTHIGKGFKDYNAENTAALGSYGDAGRSFGKFTGNIPLSMTMTKMLPAFATAGPLAKYNSALFLKNAFSAGDFAKYIQTGDNAGIANTALWNASLNFLPGGGTFKEVLKKTASPIASGLGLKDFTKSEIKTGGAQTSQFFSSLFGGGGTGVNEQGQLIPLDSLKTQSEEAKTIIESGFFNPLEKKSEEGTEKVEKVGPGLVSGITGAVKGLKSGDTGKAFMGIAGLALSFIPGGSIATGILGGLGSLFGFRNGGGITDSHILRGIPAFASGGGVYGPGTGTSDSILARVSKGEFIHDAKTVRNAGGFAAMEAIRRTINSGVAQSAVQAYAQPVVNVNVDLAPLKAEIASLKSVIRNQKVYVSAHDIADGLAKVETTGAM